MLEWTRWKKAYPGPCIYGDWPLCVVKKWKGQICMKITSFTIGPIWSPGNGNVEAWIEPHATEQWAFSPCKAKRAEHARPHTKNEWFGRWPVRPSEAETQRKNSQIRQWIKLIEQDGGLTLASGRARISSVLMASPLAAAFTSSSLTSPVMWVSNSFLSRADNLSGMAQNHCYIELIILPHTFA